MANEKSTDKSDIAQQGEAQYHRMISEVEGYAIFLMSTEGVIQSWNRGAEIIKGYKAEEIIGKNFRIFYAEGDQKSGLPESLLQIAREQGRAMHEGWRVKKNGQKFWGSIVITALHDDKGNVTGFSKVTRDLTERKTAEDSLVQYARQLEHKNEELRRSEERYHRMVDEVEDYAILLLSTEGIIQNWNRGAELIKGYKAEEIVGKSFHVFYLEADLISGLPERLLQTARDHGRAVHEGWRVRKNGSKFWGSIVITALHDDNGNVTGFSKVTRDLTERKVAEDRLVQYAQQLEQKNQELEQFAFVASHDLREPLRKISTYSDRLLGGTTTAERHRDYLERMQNASRRMMSLIDDLLAFSGIGRQPEDMEETDLRAVVTEIISDLEPVIEAKKARVSVGIMPTIMAHPSQMRQLFQNLIANSLKFNNKETPEICVSSELVSGKEYALSKGAYKIYVEDNGIGFEKEYAKKIFDIFQRLHGRLEYEGTGIGLAICKKIVEAHGGSITAEGKQGEGATFTITLPVENRPTMSMFSPV